MAISTPAADIGRPCPAFQLPAVDGRSYAHDAFDKSRCLLVVFTCNHCPYAQAVEDRVIALARAYDASKLQLVAICSNDAAAYRQMLVDLATNVAGAAKEGGFLGFGGKQVTEEEQAAIQAVASAAGQPVTA